MHISIGTKTTKPRMEMKKELIIQHCNASEICTADLGHRGERKT